MTGWREHHREGTRWVLYGAAWLCAPLSLTVRVMAGGDWWWLLFAACVLLSGTAGAMSLFPALAGNHAVKKQTSSKGGT